MAAEPTKRTTAKKAAPAAKKVTTAKAWKAKVNNELELPSGNVCLVKTVGMQAFLAKGMIPNALLPIVQEAVESGVGPSKANKAGAEALLAIQTNPAVLEDMMIMFARVVADVVIEPSVTLHVVQADDGSWVDIPLAERDPDELYTDEVDFDDQMFIFNFAVGGTRDLESFRAEQDASVVALHAQPAAGSPPKRAPRARAR